MVTKPLGVSVLLLASACTAFLLAGCDPTKQDDDSSPALKSGSGDVVGAVVGSGSSVLEFNGDHSYVKDWSNLMVTFKSADGSSIAKKVKSVTEFEIKGVTPGKYEISMELYDKNDKKIMHTEEPIKAEVKKKQTKVGYHLDYTYPVANLDNTHAVPEEYHGVYITECTQYPSSPPNYYIGYLVDDDHGYYEFFYRYFNSKCAADAPLESYTEIQYKMYGVELKESRDPVTDEVTSSYYSLEMSRDNFWVTNLTQEWADYYIDHHPANWHRVGRTSDIARKHTLANPRANYEFRVKFKSDAEGEYVDYSQGLLTMELSEYAKKPIARKIDKKPFLDLLYRGERASEFMRKGGRSE